MSDWSISRTWAIEPSRRAGYDAAYIVRLQDGAGSTHDLVIEFEAPSVLASVGYAEEIARRFRSKSEPPQQVVVDVERNIRVVGEDAGEAGGVTDGS